MSFYVLFITPSNVSMIKDSISWSEEAVDYNIVERILTTHCHFSIEWKELSRWLVEL